MFQSADAQQVRSIDGVGNNQENPQYGSAGDIQLRLTSAAYLDGISEPIIGEENNKPNPRFISNKLFSQDGQLTDPLNLSDFTWVFGQFVDHDMTLIENGHEAMLNIRNRH